MKKALIIIFLILFCLFLYGKYIEINNLKVKNYIIESDNIPDSFKDLKIVQFSDILYKNNKKLLEKTVKNINDQNPDIVIFSGDLLNKKHNYTKEEYKYLTEQFKNINAELFKFAVIGENDNKFLEEYKDILYNSGFTLLDNESKLVFYKDNTPINIVGITKIKDIDNILRSDIEYNYTLAITHKPDNAIELKEYNIDTIISGHSLGGIINIPFYGGLIKDEGAKTYIMDNYNIDNTKLFVSNGIGNKNFDFRMFNTPSINVYRFKNN